MYRSKVGAVYERTGTSVFVGDIIDNRFFLKVGDNAMIIEETLRKSGSYLYKMLHLSSGRMWHLEESFLLRYYKLVTICC